MKVLLFLTYTWFSTMLFITLIFYLATIPDLNASSSDSIDTVIKTTFRMMLYGILFVLTYRAIILSLKHTIDRLQSFRSKRERIEDAQFVLIIETLVIVISALFSTLVAIVDEWIQTSNLVSSRRGELADVLVSIMAIALTSVIVYSVPVIGEFELAVVNKFKSRNRKL